MRVLVLVALVVLSFLWSYRSHAEAGSVVQRASRIQHAYVKVKSTKDASGVVACMIPLDDMVVGERIEFRGMVRVTTENRAPTGVTIEVMEWNAPTKEWWTMRAANDQPEGTELGGGNLTLQMHHWPYFTFTDYYVKEYKQRHWFAVLLYAYRKPDPSGYLKIDGCSLRAERVRP